MTTTTQRPEPDHTRPIDRKIVIEQVGPDLWNTRSITDEERNRLRTVNTQMTINQRNKYLLDSDIYVLPDRWETYDEATKKLWADFRQALRDLPGQAGFPYDHEWPAHPKGTYE